MKTLEIRALKNNHKDKAIMAAAMAIICLALTIYLFLFKDPGFFHFLCPVISFIAYRQYSQFTKDQALDLPELIFRERVIEFPQATTPVAIKWDEIRLWKIYHIKKWGFYLSVWDGQTKQEWNVDNLDKSKEEIDALVRRYIDHATNIKMGISEEEKDSLVYNADNNAEENPETFNQQS